MLPDHAIPRVVAAGWRCCGPSAFVSLSAESDRFVQLLGREYGVPFDTPPKMLAKVKPTVFVDAGDFSRLEQTGALMRTFFRYSEDEGGFAGMTVDVDVVRQSLAFIERSTEWRGNVIRALTEP